MTTPDRRCAVALAYENHGAPCVTAKGHGKMAEEIIARAREHGIHVHESPELVTLLMNIDIEHAIPDQLYSAVAELLAWVYRVEARACNAAASQTSAMQENSDDQR